MLMVDLGLTTLPLFPMVDIRQPTLCQYSKGPKKFQFGPLKNVPIMIKRATERPNHAMNINIPTLLSLKE